MKWTKLLALSSVLCAVWMQVAVAQPLDTLWTHTYGTSRNDQGFAIQQTLDGGFIAAGYTVVVGQDDSQFYLVKTDANGNRLWSRSWNHGALWDECYAVRQMADSGYVLAGATYSFANNWDIWLVKTNANGDSLWSRTYGGGDIDVCNAVSLAADGGIVLAGYSRSVGDGLDDVWVIKTDQSGNTVWERNFSAPLFAQCNAIQSTADGGYALGGYWTGADSDQDFWLLKLNADGDSLWGRTYGDDRQQICYSVEQLPDGGYLLGGSTSPNNGDLNFWLVKTDAAGNEVWNRSFGGSQHDECRAFFQTFDNGYVAAGYTLSRGAGNSDFWVVKLNADGDSLWSRTFGGVNFDNCRAALQASDAGYVFAGVTSSYGAGSVDFWLVKTVADEAPPLTVIAPNGGEAWRSGQLQTIEWQAVNVEGAVSIQLNRDFPNGGWELLGQRDEAELLLEWMATAPVSDHCRIRVELVDNPDVFDLSDADFSIVQPGIRLSPVELNFGDVYVDSTSSLPLWIVSTGLSVLRVDSAACESGLFTVNEIQELIAPGDSLAILTHFYPQDLLEYQAEITVYSSAGAMSVPCRGHGAEFSAARELPVPSHFLLAVYPNPFNPTTIITLDLPTQLRGRLAVYDALGREVRTIIEGTLQAGAQAIQFDGTGLSSGNYFVRFESPLFSSVQKAVLLK